MFSTLQNNFGTGVEKTFFRAYNPEKKGKSKHQILPLEICTVEGRMSEKLVVNGIRIVSIEIHEKKAVLNVTLHVVDRNVSDRTQVLHRPIIKNVILVGNYEFDSPTEEPKLNVQDESHLGGAR